MRYSEGSLGFPKSCSFNITVALYFPWLLFRYLFNTTRFIAVQTKLHNHVSAIPKSKKNFS